LKSKSHDSSGSTVRQSLGQLGELYIANEIDCPECRSSKPHLLLPRNTPCVDVMCSNCGVRSQVKTISASNNNIFPRVVLGGSWIPKAKLLELNIFSPYFFVFVKNGSVDKVYYLASEKQMQDIFQVRKPLSDKAKSPGWTGYQINLRSIKHLLLEVET
jgi:hypothetical protein